jgi:hypothetical protein
MGRTTVALLAARVGGRLGGMPIDILIEAEAVAEARWRATEPPSPAGAPVATPPTAAPDTDEADPWLTRQLLRLDERLLVLLAVLAMLALLATTVLTALATR